MPEHEGGHEPGAAGAGGGGGALANRLVLGQQFHVGVGADVDPAGVAAAGGQGVAEAGVGEEAQASSLPTEVAGVGPEETVAAPLLLPVAWAWTSRAPVPLAVDSPAYSRTAAPTSAVAVGLTVMVGLAPPPAAIGAVHTDISVLSEALKWVSSV